MSHSELNIAIIGMSGEFPGANSIHEFWQNLIHDKESLSTLSAEELSNAGVTKAEFEKNNYVARAGLLKNIEYFAADFFGYSPKEATLIDPQQRKLLEHAWLACEDAALNPLTFDGPIGVFVGSSLNTYLLNNILSHPNIHESPDIQQILFGNGSDYLATRIAYQLNCRGPAINIQTACSTSLVAIHEACQHLLTYQVDAALAGGVSISVPQKGYLYSVDGMLSPDGACRPFSSDANGTVFSNGLGIVVLKRLADAISDGNPIYAVIRGSAVNNDGHQKVGYTAPSIEGQAEVIALAQANAGVSPDQISYIETHGTATQLGDPIELAALQQVFSTANADKHSCALGSLKSNIGHLDTAAGIAGFIKTALSLYHQQIPKTLHYTHGTTKFDWQNCAFYVNTSLQNITQNKEKPTIAGVSCFGIGGTNAHAILEQHIDAPINSLSNRPSLWLFSAKTSRALDALLAQFAENTAKLKCIPMDAIARTLQEGRASFRYRTVLIAHDLDEAITCIQGKHYTIVSCDRELSIQSAKPIEQCSKEDLTLIGQHWLAGASINWQDHYANYKPRMAHLPTYPFERERYWIERYQPTTHQKLPIEDWFYQPSWKPCPLSTASVITSNNRILVFLNQEITLRLNWAIFQELGLVTMVYAGDDFQVINDTTYQIDISKKDHYIQLFEALRINHRIPNYIIHGLTLTLSHEVSTIETFNAHQPNGLLSSIYLTQAWETVFQDRTLHLTVITNRLNRIAEAVHTPHKVPILAAVKVIPKEYTQMQAQLIDIDCIDYPQYQMCQLKQILQEVVKPQYDQEEIVLRGISRWLRTFTRIPVHAIASQPFNDNTAKVILITGGLGQLGLDIAHYFSQFPNVKLALIGRTPIPKQSDWATQIAQYEPEHPMRLVLERMTRMHQRGCIAHAFSADVSDKTSMTEIIREIEATLGSITGVIHAAGETVNGIISMKTECSLIESYQAKVYGSYHLCELFVEKPLDFMIFCSSMNAIIGGLGQLDNTASNSLIDYLAEYYAAQTGHNILSINWGAINMDRPLKVNVVPQFADLSTEHKRNRMSDEEVDAVYTRLLTHQLGPRLVISTLDMDDVLLNWNRVASIHDLAKEQNIVIQNRSAVPEQELPQTPVETWLADQWSRLLGLGSLSRSDHFFDLGGHSLAAVQLMTKILEHYQLKLHVMNLYEMPTLSEFACYMDKLMKQKQSKAVATA